MISPVNVNILGKEYQIACPDEEKDSLIASAQMLHQNMEKIRGTGKVVGLDRIAVMAALNLAHDLISLQNDDGHDMDEVNKKIFQMKDRVSAFLEEERQLDL
ncbi:cell division protein ZapA [Methylophaga sp. 42_25_T18]|nr:cell division protein ZapA [Methylophaga sp. 42_25_T18]OUR85725.1 cell division protein ZapA [Methylophaga sp. 42_8_T64]